MNTRFEKGLQEVAKWGLLAVLLVGAAWLGGWMTARHYTRQMTRDAAFLAGVLNHE